MTHIALAIFAANVLVMADGTETAETLRQAQRLDISVEELKAHAKLLGISVENMKHVTIVRIDEAKLIRRVVEFEEQERRRQAKLERDLQLVEWILLEFRPHPRVAELYIHGRSTAYMSLGLFRLWPGR